MIDAQRLIDLSQYREHEADLDHGWLRRVAARELSGTSVRMAMSLPMG